MASDAEKIEVAQRWIEAYNAQDNETMGALMAEDLPIQHHNRGVELKGRQAMLDILTQFEAITEGKRFHPPYRQFVAGDYVVTEHSWEATFTTDVPGFAAKDETAHLDLCSIWKIVDGQIVEYDDYG